MTYKKMLAFVFAIFVIAVGLSYSLSLQKPEGNEKLIVYDTFAYYIQDMKVSGPEIALELPSWINRESITLKLVNGYVINQYIKEANYTPPTSQEDLLKQYIGKEISVYDENGKAINGTLLKYDGKAYIKTGTALYIISPSYYELPNFTASINNGSTENASIIFKITSTQLTDARISYFIDSIRWNPDYTLYWNKDKGTLSLYGTIINNAKEYSNISLNLFYGQVNKIINKINKYLRYDEYKKSTMAESSAISSYVPISASEYYKFDLGNVDVHAGTSKFNLFEKQVGKINKSYSLPITGSDNPSSLAITLTINNSETNGLGIALPKGNVHVIDEQGFVGENYISETPKNEEFELIIGNAFDVIGSSKLMNKTSDERIYCNEKNAVTQQFCRPTTSCVEIATYEYEANVKNKKNESVNIVLTFNPYNEWVISSESMPSEKLSQYEIKWSFTLPANAEKTLKFIIKMKESDYC